MWRMGDGASSSSAGSATRSPGILRRSSPRCARWGSIISRSAISGGRTSSIFRPCNGSARAGCSAATAGVSEIGSPVGKSLVTDSWAKEWTRFEKAVEAARYFGCPRIRIFSYYLPEKSPAGKHRAEAVRRLREMTRRAEKEGIDLLHENDTGVFGETARRCREMLDAVGSDRLKAIFDPANFVRAGERPFTDCWDLLRDDVVHFNVKDCKKSVVHTVAGRSSGYSGPERSAASATGPVWDIARPAWP